MKYEIGIIDSATREMASGHLLLPSGMMFPELIDLQKMKTIKFWNTVQYEMFLFEGT
ncbi:MAG: hypothetical protein Q4G69_02565 [Planctomycetia bacterium]|nr:hypothetical protein [Planctomycetia bacterium]